MGNLVLLCCYYYIGHGWHGDVIGSNVYPRSQERSPVAIQSPDATKYTGRILASPDGQQSKTAAELLDNLVL